MDVSVTGPTGTIVDTDISPHSVSIGVISPLVTPVVCLNELLENWIGFIDGKPQPVDLNYRIHDHRLRSLFISAVDDNYPKHWKVSNSLREIGASTVIKTVQQ